MGKNDPPNVGSLPEKAESAVESRIDVMFAGGRCSTFAEHFNTFPGSPREGKFPSPFKRQQSPSDRVPLTMPSVFNFTFASFSLATDLRMENIYKLGIGRGNFPRER